MKGRRGGRDPGQRFGGRQKGTPNKRTLELMEICEKHDVNAFEGMVILSKTTDDDHLRFQCYKELCQYLYPKRKAVELTGPDGKSVDVNLSESREFVQEFKQIIMESANEKRE